MQHNSILHILSHLAAAQPPAGDPHDLEGAVQPARQGAAAVPLAGVHPAPGVASADHGGEQRLGGGGVVRQTLGQTGVRVRALNEHSQRFHNHGKGPFILGPSSG